MTETLGSLRCTQLFMHAIAHEGCRDTVRESALKVDWKKNPWLHRGIEPASAACLFNALPTELHPRPILSVVSNNYGLVQCARNNNFMIIFFFFKPLCFSHCAKRIPVSSASCRNDFPQAPQCRKDSCELC